MPASGFFTKADIATRAIKALFQSEYPTVTEKAYKNVTATKYQNVSGHSQDIYFQVNASSEVEVKLFNAEKVEVKGFNAQLKWKTAASTNVAATFRLPNEYYYELIIGSGTVGEALSVTGV